MPHRATDASPTASGRGTARSTATRDACWPGSPRAMRSRSHTFGLPDGSGGRPGERGRGQWAPGAETPLRAHLDASLRNPVHRMSCPQRMAHLRPRYTGDEQPTEATRSVAQPTEATRSAAQPTEAARSAAQPAEAARNPAHIGDEQPTEAVRSDEQPTEAARCEEHPHRSGQKRRAAP